MSMPELENLFTWLQATPGRRTLGFIIFVWIPCAIMGLMAYALGIPLDH